MAEVVDIRGRRALPACAPVLADPSGRRARMLRRGGRCVALLFLLWLIGLVLAGLGILPTGDVPLGGALAGPSSPREIPRPIGAAVVSRSDHARAAPLAQPTAGAVNVALSPSATSVRRGAAKSAAVGSGPVVARAPRLGGSRPSSTRRTTAGGATMPSSGSSPGSSTITTRPTGAPSGLSSSGNAGVSHGRSGSAPGHGKPATVTGNVGSSHGRSGSAPGQAKQTTSPTMTTSSLGHSGSAPGHTGLTGGGYGRGH
jgi:hypothetical protein